MESKNSIFYIITVLFLFLFSIVCGEENNQEYIINVDEIITIQITQDKEKSVFIYQLDESNQVRELISVEKMFGSDDIFVQDAFIEKFQDEILFFIIYKEVFLDVERFIVSVYSWDSTLNKFIKNQKIERFFGSGRDILLDHDYTFYPYKSMDIIQKQLHSSFFEAWYQEQEIKGKTLQVVYLYSENNISDGVIKNLPKNAKFIVREVFAQWLLVDYKDSDGLIYNGWLQRRGTSFQIEKEATILLEDYDQKIESSHIRELPKEVHSYLPKGSVVEKIVHADLNRDAFEDLILTVYSQNVDDQTSNIYLFIFFKNKYSGNYSLVFEDSELIDSRFYSSDQCIDEMYHTYKIDVSSKGVLELNFIYEGCHNLVLINNLYKFRYSNQFELIGYDRLSSLGQADYQEISVNFLTNRIKKTEVINNEVVEEWVSINYTYLITLESLKRYYDKYSSIWDKLDLLN